MNEPYVPELTQDARMRLLYRPWNVDPAMRGWENYVRSMSDKVRVAFDTYIRNDAAFNEDIWEPYTMDRIIEGATNE